MLNSSDKHRNLVTQIIAGIFAIFGFLSSLKTLLSGTEGRIVTVQGTTRLYSILVIGAIAAVGTVSCGDMLKNGWDVRRR